MKEFTELQLQYIDAEKSDITRAAARLANALQDIYNNVGEIPEVKESFDSVYTDVASYSGLEEIG